MKVKELKELLNQTDEMDELEIFMAPMIEIKEQPLDGSELTKTRSTASIFERYRMMTFQLMGVGQEYEGKRFARTMVIGFDASLNFGAKRPEQPESNDFVN